MNHLFGFANCITAVHWTVPESMSNASLAWLSNKCKAKHDHNIEYGYSFPASTWPLPINTFYDSRYSLGPGPILYPVSLPGSLHPFVSSSGRRAPLTPGVRPPAPAPRLSQHHNPITTTRPAPEIRGGIVRVTSLYHRLKWLPQSHLIIYVSFAITIWKYFSQFQRSISAKRRSKCILTFIQHLCWLWRVDSVDCGEQWPAPAPQSWHQHVKLLQAEQRGRQGGQEEEGGGQYQIISQGEGRRQV